MSKMYESEINAIASLDYTWEKLNGQTILISGGTGMIGSLFLDVLRARNARYGQNIRAICLSRNAQESDGTVAYRAADIKKGVDLKERFDYCIHLASNTHPKQYSEDPVGTIETNILGCRNLLEASKRAGAERFLLASSVEIYGNGNGVPMKETFCGGEIDCNTARAGYNESKRLSESLLQSYRAQYRTNGVIARLSRCFGYTPRQDTKAVAQFIEKAVAGEDIVLKSAGAQRFSYCYVADAVSALFKLLLDGKDGEAYNISDDDEEKTLGDYARLIASFAGKEVVFDFDRENNRGVSAAGYAVLDCAKIKELGWSPLYQVSDALYETYLKYKSVK